MAVTYTPTTNFGAKDSLPQNDPDKVIKGSEFTTEFTALQTAFSLAAPNASPTFTGTVTIPTADINGGSIDGTIIGASTPAAGSFTTGQFGTSLNVDGTVTADGAEIIGDVAINTTTPATYLHIVPTDGELNDAFTGFRISRSTSLKAAQYSTYSHAGGSATITSTVTTGGAGGSFRVLSSADGTTTKSILNVSSNNDFSLYEDTGTTPKFFWDASAERLGLGTTSPSAKLEIAETDSVTYSSSAVQGDLIISRKNSANTVNQVVGLEFDVTGWSGSTTGIAGISAIQTGSNASSAALAFQTRNAGTIAEAMRIDSSGNVGIGITPEADWSTAYHALQVGTTATFMGAASGSGEGNWISNNAIFSTSGSWEYLQTASASSLDMQSSTAPFRFRYAASGTAGTAISWSEAMRIDSSGNLLVGTTSTTPAFSSTGYGIALKSGESAISADGAIALIINRNTSDGVIQQFRKGGTMVGSINSRGGEFIAIGYSDTYLEFNAGSNQINPSSGSAARDDAIDLGSSGARFDDIYATNALIQTSDRNEKQDIEELSEAERRVAVAAKGLLRKFRWISSVEEKGDDARIHFGIIAQDLQAAFEAEGLDAGRYAMFIHSTWTDEETGEERSRMGVRYSELLAFIIAAL